MEYDGGELGNIPNRNYNFKLDGGRPAGRLRLGRRQSALLVMHQEPFDGLLIVVYFTASKRDSRGNAGAKTFCNKCK